MKCEHGITPWWDCDPCRATASFGEEPLEPYVDEHLGPEPIHITTRSERRQIMARNNLEYHDVSKNKRGRNYSFMGGK